MENTLIEQPSAADVIALLQANGRSQYATDKALSTVTTAGGFLPYIQLHGSNSAEVKRGKFPIGHYALVKNKKNVDIGDGFVALLLSWRPKAMRYKPTVMSYFDTNNAEFQKIEDAAKSPNSNCGFGPEFLIWLPDHEEFATFFLGNISGRMESPNFIHCLEKGSKICRAESVLIESKKNGHAWHTPQMAPYDVAIKFPPMEVLAKQLTAFNTPPATEAEPVEADDAANDRA